MNQTTEVNEINNFIKNKEISEINLYRFENDKLTITGSKDNIYYHNMELIFTNPAYISGPLSFQISENCEFIEEVPLTQVSNWPIFSDSDIPLRAFSMRSSEGPPLTIAAERLETNTDMVYHYNREKLKENERLAYWLIK
ncbi:hypothetical protein [Paracidovorax avenae]|uniref:hypothetical protein n=1 Tax=Paracidovorax avenae TaxID=80867 RepID=UPI001AD7EFDE|nr:hypothetical protein [Paracidovorax avenae]